MRVLRLTISQVLSSHGRPVDLQPPFTPFVVLAWVVFDIFFCSECRGDIGGEISGSGMVGSAGRHRKVEVCQLKG